MYGASRDCSAVGMPAQFRSCSNRMTGERAGATHLSHNSIIHLSRISNPKYTAADPLPLYRLQNPQHLARTWVYVPSHPNLPYRVSLSAGLGRKAVHRIDVFLSRWSRSQPADLRRNSQSLDLAPQSLLLEPVRQQKPSQKRVSSSRIQ